MLCPSCGYTLQALSVSTDSGGRFEIDHCGRCGGTWFDPYEINRIPYYEVNRLAHLTVLPKNQPLSKTENLFCPRCHKVMARYTGESVPRHVTLLRCPKCHGIWATQRALESFKKEQNLHIEKYKTKKSAFPSLSVVFVPAIFMMLLFFGTYITVTNLSKSREERIQAAEEITNLRETSISPTMEVVTFQTKNPFVSEISYGPSSFDLTDKIISATPQTKHHILLTNLKPNTIYIYKITLIDETGRKLVSDPQSFTTPSKILNPDTK